MEIVNKGKKLVICLIVTILILNFIVTAILSSLYAISNRMDLANYRIIQGIFRFIVSGVILYFMYKGHQWAKWLLVVLFMVGGISGFISLTSGFNLILVVLSIVYVCFGAMMIFSRSINTFYLYQRGLYPLDIVDDVSMNDTNITNQQE